MTKEEKIEVGNILFNVAFDEPNVHEWLTCCAQYGFPFCEMVDFVRRKDFDEQMQKEYQESEQCAEDVWAISMERGLFTYYVDMEEDELNVYKPTMDDFYMAFYILATKYPWHYRSIIDDNSDYETYMAFMQCYVLGDIELDV